MSSYFQPTMMPHIDNICMECTCTLYTVSYSAYHKARQTRFMYDLRVIVAVVVIYQLDVRTCPAHNCSESFIGLMKVITASSKRCNKRF